MAHGRAGGRQDTLELHGGNHIGEFGILVVVKFGWVKGIKARCQNHRTDVEGFGCFFLIEINRTGGAEFLTGTALALLNINTGITVDAVFQGHRLGILDIGGLAFDQPHIVLILDLFGAFFST